MSSEQADPDGSNPGENTGEAADTAAYREYGERLLERKPDITPAMFAGQLSERNGVEPDAAIDLYDELTEAKHQDPDAYIDDPDFGGGVDAVRDHYKRVRPVYERFGDLDGAPTTAWIGNAGVYADKEYFSDDDGNAVVRRRAKTIERDLDAAISDISHNPEDTWRTLYNHTSWKKRRSVYDGIVTETQSELGQGDGLAGYGDMRGFPLWVDLDLRDNDDGADGPNYKRRRGSLGDDVRETVEQAYRAYVDEFAELFGGEPADVAVFDSGGGGYLYTPAALTLPIGERYADDSGPGGDARKLVFQELRKRLFAYGTGAAVNKNAGDYGFEGIETRVNDRVDGAAELLDPDWMQNVNRQSKAPLAIHGDHDVVVTPARPADEPGRITYEPTPVSAVDDALIEHTAREAEKIVSVPDRDVLERWTEEFVSTLFPEYSEDGDGWRETLDSWLAEQRQRRRDRIHQRALDEREQRQRLRDRVDDRDGDGDSQRSAGALLGELDVTPIRKDIFDVLDGATAAGAEFTSRADVREWWRNGDDELLVDVRDVIENHAADEWLTADRGHEITFDPSWRKSKSGESCAVEWVSNDRDDPSDPSVGNGFVDNSCGGSGGPAKAYALGTGILPTADDPDKSDRDSAAAESLDGKAWADAVEGLRSEGYPIPMYVPEAGSEGPNGEPYEQTPLWGLRKAAVALGVCDRDDFVERETDDGETYRGFDGPTYNAVLRALEDAGIDHGREPIDTEKRSDYYDVDLAAYADGGDPWTDPDTMLRACLRARDDDAVSEHATPPTMALLPLRRDVLEQQPSRDMSSGTKALLEDLFHELTVDGLDDVLDG
jgi:hypothetical protein